MGRWNELMSLTPGLWDVFDREFTAEWDAVLTPYLKMVQEDYPTTLDTIHLDDDSRWSALDELIGAKADIHGRASDSALVALQTLGPFSEWPLPTADEFRRAVVAHTCENSSVGEKVCFRHSIALV